jgi:hypothetical protein
MPRDFTSGSISERSPPTGTVDQPDRGQGTMDAGFFDEISGWSPNEKPAAYYRAAAERARKLLAEATTPRLKQYLGEVIARCERFAEER